MPRGFTAKKQSANSQTGRQESLSSASGRRVSKQKSNGHLNASPNGTSPLPSPPVPSTALAQNISAQHASDRDGNGRAAGTMAASNGRPAAGRTYSDGQVNSDVYQNGPGANGLDEQSHRRIDVNASKAATGYETSFLYRVSTILRSCPLGDTIAILIILLQLPPTFLTITHFLFTTLTFVPPSGVSISSIPSLKEIFQGSGGTPSLATTVIADVVFLIFWLFLWAPAQNVALDLAQVVMAISLGGGYTGNSGGSNSAIMCFAIIGASHLLRRKSLRQYGLSFIWSIASGSEILPLRAFPAPVEPPDTTKTTNGWIRSILAVHILTQGVVRMVRRWISRREMHHHHNNQQPSVPASKKRGDPEAAVASQAQSTNSTSTDSGPDAPTAPSLDGQSVGPAAVTKDPKEKISSGKKKRKQATHVRSQQPFWAALASTKVIVMKEYEQSQAAAEAAGSKATDVNNLGSAPFDEEGGRVWVTQVGSTEIYFHTSAFPPGEQSAIDYKDGCQKSGSRVDKSKPFYVRLNGADWTSTKITKCEAGKDGLEDQWVGEIFGLTALTSYCCEFVRSEDDVVIFSSSITTHPPSLEQASTATPPPPHQTLRPSSPTTTLRNSISAAESKLIEVRSRTKRVRKEHKTALTALKKEVDNFGSRLSSAGSGDDRQRQRVLQITQHIRQAEESASNMGPEIEEMGNIPEDDIQEWRATKKSIAKEKDASEALREEFNETKEQADRKVSSVQSEASSSNQKRERLLARQAKLNEQHNRMVSVNAQAQEEKDRRASELATKDAERQQTEVSYLEQLALFGRQTQEINSKSQQAWQRIHRLELAYSHQQAQLQQKMMAAQAANPAVAAAVSEAAGATLGPGAATSMAGPIAPGGPLAGSNLTAASAMPAQQPGYAFPFSAFGPPGQHASGVVPPAAGAAAAPKLEIPSFTAAAPFSRDARESIGNGNGNGNGTGATVNKAGRARSGSTKSNFTDFSDTAENSFLPGQAYRLSGESQAPLPVSATEFLDRERMVKKSSSPSNRGSSASGSVGGGSQRDPSSPFVRHSSPAANKTTTPTTTTTTTSGPGVIGSGSPAWR
ncbi:hypothetical protein L228DRAFT_60528 [Xylona heveae TC161]|uniref:Ubiquitination network signaling protein n=1 Tax=Xylona heveae (strain CBS 132557 / TC161) TaxID=1328760 RepID=A0A165IKL6_XYLHT|nr:hypothetical protein L228DRAFT_60528 [Xylona heveae TC161]KZF25034.1 hypothetical protein L228DRAFT_60528 [Xylona heveae TC161]